MTLYYSASTAGFYDDGIHTTLPSDVVVITQEEHQELLTAQSEGRVITAGEDGRPEALSPAAPSLDEVKLAARAKVDILRQAEEENGFIYSFPGPVEDRVQTRNTRDLLNVQSMITTARLLKAAGVTDLLPFQGESNVTHMLSSEEFDSLGLALANNVMKLYSTAWALKNAIDAAETVEDAEAASVWPETVLA